MLVPSTVVGLVGMALTGVLMVADWYIWDFRHRILAPGAPDKLRRSNAVRGEPFRTGSGACLRKFMARHAA